MSSLKYILRSSFYLLNNFKLAILLALMLSLICSFWFGFEWFLVWLIFWIWGIFGFNTILIAIITITLIIAVPLSLIFNLPELSDNLSNYIFLSLIVLISLEILKYLQISLKLFYLEKKIFNQKLEKKPEITKRENFKENPNKFNYQKVYNSRNIYAKQFDDKGIEKEENYIEIIYILLSSLPVLIFNFLIFRFTNLIAFSGWTTGYKIGFLDVGKIPLEPIVIYNTFYQLIFYFGFILALFGLKLLHSKTQIWILIPTAMLLVYNPFTWQSFSTGDFSTALIPGLFLLLIWNFLDLKKTLLVSWIILYLNSDWLYLLFLILIFQTFLHIFNKTDFQTPKINFNISNLILIIALVLGLVATIFLKVRNLSLDPEINLLLSQKILEKTVENQSLQNLLNIFSWQEYIFVFYLIINLILAIFSKYKWVIILIPLSYLVTRVEFLELYAFIPGSSKLINSLLLFGWICGFTSADKKITTFINSGFLIFSLLIFNYTNVVVNYDYLQIDLNCNAKAVFLPDSARIDVSFDSYKGKEISKDFLNNCDFNKITNYEYVVINGEINYKNTDENFSKVQKILYNYVNSSNNNKKNELINDFKANNIQYLILDVSSDNNLKNLAETLLLDKIPSNIKEGIYLFEFDYA